MRKIIAIVSLTLLSGVAYLAFHASGSDSSAGQQRPAAPPVVVAAVTAREETWQPSITATGSLRAYQGVSVTAQQAGMITAIHFESGHRVRKGDLLVQQYVKDEQVRLEGLRAELNLARKSYDRSQSLIGKQAVSQSQLDSTLSEQERTKALVENLEVSIEKRSIRAPFDGVLGIRQVNVGQYIEPGDEIVSLEALDPIYVEFTVPQNRLPEVVVGQEVLIVVDAYPEGGFSGHINAIESRIDAATRSFRVQAEIPNAERKLHPGMYVSAEIMLPARQSVVTLPQAAIIYNPYGDSVFVVAAGSAGGEQVVKTVYVTLGETRGDQVAVLSGVKHGDVVVSAGQLRLRDGSAVTIDETIDVGNSVRPGSG